MKGAAVVAEILKREGVTTLYGYPRNRLIEAAAAADIRPIITRQERTGIHMADALSRLTSRQKIGVFAMQQGPGTENAFGAVAQAYVSLSDEEVNEIVLANRAQYKAVEGISVESVLKRLNQARRRGYALNEFRTSINTRTVSLRIVNRFGYPFAAITIGAIESRMSEARQKDLVSLLKSEIAQLERAMNQVGATGMQ